MSKQNLLTSQLSILLLGVVIGVFASIGFSYISKPSIHQVGTACTAEAKICPDGSTVGRVGPNCEFTPCSATISKPPGYFDTGCSIDDDCVLVDKESVDCCGNNGCQPVDYSQDKWIAANARWQAERISKNCLTNMACPNCLPRPINEN
ncbi:hypothetical protein A3F58_04030 [Candidatus Roizmanbacteria bacterium RIFCSPHIGHO2_12_FULL_37_9b]|nr:MAG: hypothetical protein A3F58_04030 [Candidatus Roizmanbacteria bacterium RIFCSPHIGHO2_12_FULL_37_9b]